MSGVRLQVTVQGGRLELDKKLLRQTLRAAGTEVASVARGLIRGTGVSGKLYRGRKTSTPGQPPVSRSGSLASSLKVSVFKSGEGVAIRDTARSRSGSGAPYALFLEKGAKGGGGRKGNRNRRGKPSTTRVLQPRPFLSTALNAREASIAQRVADSINQGLKFVRQKS